MKKTILFLATLLALTVGCQRAEDLSPDTPVFKEVAVNIGENGDETRSLISIEAEDFKKASLFAFYHSTGKIAVYPESAGDQAGTGPVAIEVTEKQFNWALPIGQALDIYVIVNYNDELGSTLAGYRSDGNLTETTLNALKFTALDNVYMSDVEASGPDRNVGDRRAAVEVERVVRDTEHAIRQPHARDVLAVAEKPRLHVAHRVRDRATRAIGPNARRHHDVALAVVPGI